MFEYTGDDEIIVGQGEIRENAPMGIHPAVCVDIVNLGMESIDYGKGPVEQPKIMVVWQVFPEDGERDSNGQPFIAERKFTASLAPSANLRAFLEQWRGRAFTAEELKGFNLARLKGANCSLTIEHRPGQGLAVYANVIAVEPLTLNGERVSDPAKLLKPESYTRRDYSKRGASNSNAQAQTATAGAGNATDKSDWVPF